MRRFELIGALALSAALALGCEPEGPTQTTSPAADSAAIDLGVIAAEVIHDDEDWEPIALHQNDADYPLAYGQSGAVADIVTRPAGSRGSACTGFLVTKDLLMTATHCIRDNDPFGETIHWNAPKTAAFGREKSLTTNMTPVGRQFSCNEIVDYSVDYDIAVLRCLPDGLGRLPGDLFPTVPLASVAPTGHHDLYAITANCKRNERDASDQCTTPAQRHLLLSPGGTTPPVPQQRFDRCHVTDPDDAYIVEWSWSLGFEHNCDTMRGSSGGPIFRKNTGEVLGVVSAHNWEPPFSLSNRAGGVWHYVADNDMDNDGRVDWMTWNIVDRDGDGWSENLYAPPQLSTFDCDDTDPNIHPYKLEICDGLDNDCDGQTDEAWPDKDGDGLVDCNDPDIDNDGVPNDADLCPSVADNQTDSDGDGLGNACDDCDFDAMNDIDEDSICGDIDNCPNQWNLHQEDLDGDGIGDACDGDDDGDGLPDEDDLCPMNPEPTPTDTDNDGHGDECDNCPEVPNPDQSNSDTDSDGNACDEDDDNDGVPDEADNCPFRANPDQENTDGDAQGDACDDTTPIWMMGPAFDARMAAIAAVLGEMDIPGPFGPWDELPKCPGECGPPLDTQWSYGVHVATEWKSLGGFADGSASLDDMRGMLALDGTMPLGVVDPLIKDRFGLVSDTDPFASSPGCGKCK